MRSLSLTIILAGILIITSCGTVKTTGESDITSYSELEEVIEHNRYEIENQWASPLGGDRVDLFSNPNYLRFRKDSVDIFLPYFGVRHTVSNYGDEGGIKYEGKARNFQIDRYEDKNKMVLEFEIEKGTENLDFQITVFSNGNTVTSVTSSQRSAISYQGKLKELTADEENKQQKGKH
ncbi:DUF4251 domain-containing protein [Salegentibacter chungangensis]|uniref:DUF4251 domain-containing protein n=1 Tax=Salegentibacter chungangensis TaxID=1335724 RepID=A0ABW3NTU9_9FLAO